jgi:hypothetical protein
MTASNKKTAPAIDLLHHVCAIADATQDLLHQLVRGWPIEGQGDPPDGWPTNVRQHHLRQRLLELVTAVARLRAPDNSSLFGPWLVRMAPIRKLPGVMDALGTIDTVLLNLGVGLGFKEDLERLDGSWPVPALTPTPVLILPTVPAVPLTLLRLLESSLRALRGALPGGADAGTGALRKEEIRADRSGEKADKLRQKMAALDRVTVENPDVREFLRRVKQRKHQGRPWVAIAREITEENETRAQTILREVRRLLETQKDPVA